MWEEKYNVIYLKLHDDDDDDGRAFSNDSIDWKKISINLKSLAIYILILSSSIKFRFLYIPLQLYLLGCFQGYNQSYQRVQLPVDMPI